MYGSTCAAGMDSDERCATQVPTSVAGLPRVNKVDCALDHRAVKRSACQGSPRRAMVDVAESSEDPTSTWAGASAPADPFRRRPGQPTHSKPFQTDRPGPLGHAQKPRPIPGRRGELGGPLGRRLGAGRSLRRRPGQPTHRKPFQTDRPGPLGHARRPSDPWIETPTSPSAADPFGAATSPALPARAEGSPSVSVPPDNTPADPWSQQPAAPAAEAPGGTPATGARKLRKKLARASMHHAGARADRLQQGQGEGQGEARQEKVERAARRPSPRGPRATKRLLMVRQM